MPVQREFSAFVTQELGADYLRGLKGKQGGIPERAQQPPPRMFRLEQRTRPAGAVADPDSRRQPGGGGLRACRVFVLLRRQQQLLAAWGKITFHHAGVQRGG